MDIYRLQKDFIDIYICISASITPVFIAEREAYSWLGQDNERLGLDRD